MGREATGEVRRASDGTLSCRIRVAGKRSTFRLPTCQTEGEANDRAAVLARMASSFRKASVDGDDHATKLLDMAASATAAMLRGVLTVAGEFARGELVASTKSDAPTFETVARAWLSGDLRKRFPDHIRPVSERYTDATLRRLESVFSVIGSKPVASITRADCDEAMRQLPVPKGKTELLRETRRQYAVAINRVLNLAELAGHIERNPLPRGWLPRSGDDKRFPILYPSEDRAQLASTKAPLWRRLLCGFAHREGVRRGEALALRWSALDLENDTITLDVNKTNHSRYWRLDAGTAEALRRWRQLRGDVKPTDLVFVDGCDSGIDADHLSDAIRADLAAAGVVRADLTSKGANKGRFGFHCYRRSFVTRNLALGKNEDWVRQRTGHKSDELLRYRQGAKAFAELALGDLEPLCLAIPELRSDNPEQPWGNECPAIAPWMVGAAGFEPATLRPPV
jgi:integrase